MNSTSTTSGRIMYVDAEVLYKALVETYVGRGRKDFAAVRVGKTRGAVIRSHEGLVARTRFPCRSVAPGVLLLPPMARDVLVGITGEVEVEYGGVGDRQRVRILHGGKRLLDHVVRDARLNNVSPEESRIPTGAPIHGPPLAFALHQADAFVDLASLRQREHRAVYVGPMHGVEHGVVLARDDHGVVAIQLEGLGPSALRVPLRHLDAVARFLRGRPTVMASSSGARYFLTDDEGSAVGWTCDVEPQPMDTPPAWPTARVDRDELVAAIDRLQTGPETVVVLTMVPAERRMMLRRGGEATEAVTLRDGPSRAPASVCVRLTRLRRACDTASRELELFVCTKFVMTLERGLVSAGGRLLQRRREDTIAMVAHRLVGTMEPSGVDRSTSPAEPVATDSPATSGPTDSGEEAVAQASAREQVIEQSVSRGVSEETRRDFRTPVGELVTRLHRCLTAFCTLAEADRGKLDTALVTHAMLLVDTLAAFIRAADQQPRSAHALLDRLSRALEVQASGLGAPCDPVAAAQAAAEALVSTEHVGQLSMSELVGRVVAAEVLGAVRFAFEGLWDVDWDPGPPPGRLPEQLWAVSAGTDAEIDEATCEQLARAVPDPRLPAKPLADPSLSLELVAAWLLHRGRLPVGDVARADAEERVQRDALFNEIMESVSC